MKEIGSVLVDFDGTACLHDVAEHLLVEFGDPSWPLLSAAGIDDLPVITNTWVDGGEGLRFDNGHGTCIGCGTCKMRAVLEARDRGPVAFVGEGSSDRFGAIYADLVFAKDALVRIANADGVPFLPWTTFDDVRAGLETLEKIPGPVGADRCPGWRVA